MIRASGGAVGAGRQHGGGSGRVCVAAVLGLALLAMNGACAWGAGAEKPKPEKKPLPWVTISLSSLGVPTLPASFLDVGASMLTLGVVDDTHLLVTFSTRGLVPRIPGDPPDDEDRMVAAELVELPSGRVVERTDWHLHDHSRYLWRLGKGRFLVRSRQDLFLLTPEARLKTKDPLLRTRFTVRDGQPVAAFVSPEKSLLMVETVTPEQKAKLEMTSSNAVVNEPKPQVMIDFFRLKGGDEPGSELAVRTAGVVQAPAPMLVPLDGDGYLWPGEGQRGRWPVTFNEFGGREVKVGPVDSSCQPRLQMVSRFEYLAFTCMGTDDRSRVKAYGMDGHETWEDSLGGTFGIPEFAFAPQAGRFAMSRITSLPGETDDLGFGNVLPSNATQEVRVYQTESGDLLLKVPTTPVTRFAENFDLSEDGMVAAVVRDGAVEVYKLPAPSKQDVKDLEEAKSFCPPLSDAPVSFAKLESADDAGRVDVAAREVRVAGGSAAGAGGAGTAAAAGAGPAAGAAKLGVKASAADDAGGPGGGSTAVAGDVRKAAARTSGAVAASAAGAGGDAGAAVQAGDAAAGDAEGRRRPPTLLEPGEKTETVKGSGEASAQPPR